MILKHLKENIFYTSEGGCKIKCPLVAETTLNRMQSKFVKLLGSENITWSRIRQPLGSCV